MPIKLTGSENIPETTNVQESAGKIYIGYILVTMYGLSQGATVLLIRGISVAEITYEAQLIWTHCLALLLSLILMFIFENPTLPPNLKNSMYLTGHVSTEFSCNSDLLCSLELCIRSTSYS